MRLILKWKRWTPQPNYKKQRTDRAYCREQPTPRPAPGGRVTCEVLCLEVQIVELVNVAYVHLFLVQFSLIEVL